MKVKRIWKMLCNLKWNISEVVFIHSVSKSTVIWYKHWKLWIFRYNLKQYYWHISFRGISYIDSHIDRYCLLFFKIVRQWRWRLNINMFKCIIFINSRRTCLSRGWNVWNVIKFEVFLVRIYRLNWELCTDLLIILHLYVTIYYNNCT